MASYAISVMEGDGVGKEVTRSALEILGSVSSASGVSLDFTPAPAGDAVLAGTGEALPQQSLSVIRGSDACLKGPVGETAAAVIVKLRQVLDLYANIRPAKSMPGVPCLRPDIDFVIVRENTEDLYRGLEFEVADGVVAMRVTTMKACARIADRAFRLAMGRKAKKVVAVHKANVMRKSCGLFSSACREAAARYPAVSFSEMYVDAAAMNLIRSPESFDVIVTTNMFGDILSDEAAQLVGGLGIAPSANLGDKFAIFEPVHGSAPDIAGKGIANPVGISLSACMMLEWLGESREDRKCGDAASALRAAIERAVQKGAKTPDLGGSLTTEKMTREIVAELRR